MRRQCGLFIFLILYKQPNEEKDGEEDEKKDDSPGIPRILTTAPLKS